jgi:hypothetical protein
MEDRLIIGTGWYADEAGHNNPLASKRLYQRDWLETWWRINFHRLKGVNFIPFIYESDCPITFEEHSGFYKGDSFIGGWIKSSLENRTFTRYFDHWNSLVFGALYAYANHAYFLYVEQDCLVKSIIGVLHEAFHSDKKMCYGFGKWSYEEGWAENSLVFVDRSFTHEFAARILAGDHPKTKEKEEAVFHQLFKDDAHFWSFGYGRHHESVNWNDETFYLQQVTDQEIDKFVQAIKY